MDGRREVVRVPVPGVDRARDFCQGPGWRLDVGFRFGDGRRPVQVTPPGPGAGA